MTKNKSARNEKGTGLSSDPLFLDSILSRCAPCCDGSRKIEGPGLSTGPFDSFDLLSRVASYGATETVTVPTGVARAMPCCAAGRFVPAIPIATIV